MGKLKCLSLVTSHVVGTSRAENTTSYMSYKQIKTLSLFTTRQPIQVLKKSVTSVFFVIDHFSRHKHQQSRAYVQLLIGAKQQPPLYHTINLKLGHCKSWEKMWAKKTEIVCHWSLLMLLEIAEQSIQLLKCHTSR